MSSDSGIDLTADSPTRDSVDGVTAQDPSIQHALTQQDGHDPRSTRPAQLTSTDRMHARRPLAPEFASPTANQDPQIQKSSPLPVHGGPAMPHPGPLGQTASQPVLPETAGPRRRRPVIFDSEDEEEAVKPAPGPAAAGLLRPALTLPGASQAYGVPVPAAHPGQQTSSPAGRNLQGCVHTETDRKAQASPPGMGQPGRRLHKHAGASPPSGAAAGKRGAPPLATKEEAHARPAARASAGKKQVLSMEDRRRLQFAATHEVTPPPDTGRHTHLWIPLQMGWEHCDTFWLLAVKGNCMGGTSSMTR